ncbi:MAG: efflux RND transporter periplasmic adaptor subunit, partial [Candidatus Binatia bacterium]
MKLTSRQLAAALGILLLGASGYAYFRNHGRDGVEEFLTESVTRGPIASTVTATGTINPVKTVQVGTYVSGPIQAIYVDYNSPVKKDQPVAKIDPRPFTVKVMSADAAVANARAKVAKARADLAFKKLAFERNRQLLERKLIAQSDFDIARSQYDQALAQLDLDEAGVKQAAADLEGARINLAYTDITSPVDGVV